MDENQQFGENYPDANQQEPVNQPATTPQVTDQPVATPPVANQATQKANYTPFIIIICVLFVALALSLGYIAVNHWPFGVEETETTEAKKDKEEKRVDENIGIDEPTEKPEMPVQETVETIASFEGLSAHEFLKKIGLEDSGLTEKSTAEELWNVLTIENIALMKDLDVNEFKAMYGIEELDNNMLWNDAQFEVPIGKIAEVEYGLAFEQFAIENALPETITAETTFEEALAIMEAQNAAELETE